MQLDLRTPIGLMFTIFGALLTLFGMFTGPDLYKRSLDININLWWGLIMLAFGAVMLGLAWRASLAPQPEPPSSPKSNRPSGH